MNRFSSILLSVVPPNQVATVVTVNVPTEDAARLKSLGVCVGRKVQVVKQGDPLIIRVVGTRVGISARLAEAVQVHLLTKTA